MSIQPAHTVVPRLTVGLNRTRGPRTAPASGTCGIVPQRDAGLVEPAITPAITQADAGEHVANCSSPSVAPLVVGGGLLFLPVRGVGVHRGCLGEDLVHLGRFDVLREMGSLADLEALFDRVGDRNLLVDRLVGGQLRIHGPNVPRARRRETHLSPG